MQPNDASPQSNQKRTIKRNPVSYVLIIFGLFGLFQDFTFLFKVKPVYKSILEDTGQPNMIGLYLTLAILIVFQLAMVIYAIRLYQKGDQLTPKESKIAVSMLIRFFLFSFLLWAVLAYFFLTPIYSLVSEF